MRLANSEVTRDTVPVQPETLYAKSGDVSIAYQVTGDGPFDVVFIPPFVTHVELVWTTSFGPALERLSSKSRRDISQQGRPRSR